VRGGSRAIGKLTPSGLLSRLRRKPLSAMLSRLSATPHALPAMLSRVSATLSRMSAVLSRLSATLSRVSAVLSRPSATPHAPVRSAVTLVRNVVTGVRSAVTPVRNAARPCRQCCHACLQRRMPVARAAAPPTGRRDAARSAGETPAFRTSKAREAAALWSAGVSPADVAASRAATLLPQARKERPRGPLLARQMLRLNPP
jgi:hypothetical protein